MCNDDFDLPYSGQAWFSTNHSPYLSRDVLVPEEEEPPLIVFDAEGNPLVREKVRMGFKLE
jgi:hypothetical protein